MEISRRQLGRMAIGGLATAVLPKSIAMTLVVTVADSAVNGVPLGVAVGSYRDVPRGDNQQEYIAALARACADSGSNLLVEYHNSQLEPAVRLRPRRNEPPFSREEYERRRLDRRSWRINTPLSYFEGVRATFEAAGNIPFAYSFNFLSDMTDEEIEAVFLHTQALGVTIISTNATQVDMAARLAPFAERHAIDLGFHNHDDFEDPNEIASLASFEAVMSESDRCKANLDVGHFVAANLDPIAFIEQHHARITHLHFKDRNRDKGARTPWGEGETPLAEVLTLVRENNYGIPCLAEYEHHNTPGVGTSVVEYQKCLAFMRSALESSA